MTNITPACAYTYQEALDRFDILDRADGKADGKISTPLSNINPGEAISFLDLLGGHNIRGVKIICLG